MEHNTHNGKINNAACEAEMEKTYAKYDQNGVSIPQTLEAEQEFKQAHELVTELDRALALVLDGIVADWQGHMKSKDLRRATWPPEQLVKKFPIR